MNAAPSSPKGARWCAATAHSTSIRDASVRRRVAPPFSVRRDGRTLSDLALVKALARAFRWRRMMESGVVSTVGEISVREKINKSYVSRVLRLTLLGPEIVEAILDGRQAPEMTLPGLMRVFPLEWDRQRLDR